MHEGYELPDPLEVSEKEARMVALRDVGYITQNSAVIAHLQNVEIILRKALALVANARLYELRTGWQTSMSYAVIAQLMSEISFNKAYTDGVVTAASVNASLLRTVIPSLDMLGVEFEKLQQSGVDVEELYQAFFRHDKSSKGALAGVQCPSDSDTVEETGKCSGGDRGEDSSTGS
jgi:hypothetical protein